ncbi:hypothetical protein PENSPDRAFT_737502 [Peniophora sp. CONT]|nr:hypothetical protein PENSPDRAFT_737502 [Peniophora sp. CONT]
MSIHALFWQSAKGTANVGALYRNQCVEAIRICRSLRSEGVLQPGDMIRLHLVLECACTALDSAAREDAEAESAFRVFREAVDEVCKMNEVAAKWIQNKHSHPFSMDAAKSRDDDGTDKRKSILAKLSSYNTERRVLSHTGTTQGSLVTFFIAPCEHTVRISETSLLQLNFHVDHAATLPELVFRFHRKHCQRWSKKLPFRSLRFPHFYVKRELDNVHWRVVHPLDSTSMGTLEPEDTIWVYGDRPNGPYELVRGARRSRIRSVSFAPVGNDLERVYRDICGYLALERFLFSNVFSPWRENDAALQGCRPSACIREDPCRTGKAIIVHGRERSGKSRLGNRSVDYASSLRWLLDRNDVYDTTSNGRAKNAGSPTC